jgi:hypothetical protein
MIGARGALSARAQTLSQIVAAHVRADWATVIGSVTRAARCFMMIGNQRRGT